MFIDMIEVKAEKNRKYIEKALEALDILESGTGKGSEFLGWKNYPLESSMPLACEFEGIREKWMKMGVETVVVIGIGGSYLGAKAALEALRNPFGTYANGNKGMDIVFAGHNLSSSYHYELLRLMERKSCAAVVISKSGTTTEPAIAFRLVREALEKKYGQKASERIVAVTDASKGALKKLSDEKGYLRYVIPDDVGGRYSVLTAVGLLPLALAGYDIRSMIEGAVAMSRRVYVRDESNPAVIYAAARNACYMEAGKKVEIMLVYEPSMQYFSEWWKQLFGESEGKSGRGIFPSSAVFTSDLHSMGQYIQEGERCMFETAVSVGRPRNDLDIPVDGDDLDGLNFLAGKTMDHCNKMAMKGTRMAHEDAGVPNIIIEIPEINEYVLGGMFYMMEVACAVSAYMLGVNPFDQPGVEAYKKNMFALLEKPGYGKITDRTCASES